MDAGIGDQPRGAEQFGIQSHEIGSDIGKGAEFLADALGIKPPAFAKGDIAGDRTEFGAALLAHLDIALGVMAGHRFMAHQRVERRRIGRHADEMDKGPCRALAIGAGRRGMGGAAGEFAERRLADDFDAIGWQRAEQFRQQRAGMGDEFIGGLQIIGARRIVIGPWREARGAILVKGAAVLEAGGLCQRVLFGLDPRHFLAADGVDFVGGEVGGGVELEFIGIIGSAAGQGDGADLAAGRGRQLRFCPGDDAVIGGLERQNGGARLGEPGIGIGARQLAGGDECFGLALDVSP